MFYLVYLLSITIVFGAFLIMIKLATYTLVFCSAFAINPAEKPEKSSLYYAFFCVPLLLLLYAEGFGVSMIITITRVTVDFPEVTWDWLYWITGALYTMKSPLLPWLLPLLYIGLALYPPFMLYLYGWLLVPVMDLLKSIFT